MTAIPRSALILGAAGVLPFIWGAATIAIPALSDWTIATIGPRFVGPYVSLAYGTVILSFMSGTLWGFATRARGAEAAIGYALSVLPALWAFFFVGNGPVTAAFALALGFAGLLVLDYYFVWRGLAPKWWMQLRVMLSVPVILCLALIILT